MKPLAVVGAVLFVGGAAVGGNSTGAVRGLLLMLGSTGFGLLLLALAILVWNRATLGRGVRVVLAGLAALFAVAAFAGGMAQFTRSATAVGDAALTEAPSAATAATEPPSAASGGTASPDSAAASVDPAAGEPYTLTLPSGWLAVDAGSPSSKASLDAFAKANPGMAATIAGFESSKIYRLAVNQLTGDAIVSAALPTQGLTLAQIGQALTAQFATVPGASVAAAPDSTQLPAGDALHWTVGLSANKATGGSAIVTESVYVVASGQTAVMVVFVTPSGGVPAEEGPILDSLVIK